MLAQAAQRLWNLYLGDLQNPTAQGSQKTGLMSKVTLALSLGEVGVYDFQRTCQRKLFYDSQNYSRIPYNY